MSLAADGVAGSSATAIVSNIPTSSAAVLPIQRRTLPILRSPRHHGTLSARPCCYHVTRKVQRALTTLVYPCTKASDVGTLDRRELEKRQVTTVLAETPTVVADHAFTTGKIKRTSIEKVLPNSFVERKMENGLGCDASHYTAAELLGKIVPDEHVHEHATCFYVKDKGLVVLSSCGHVGIVNSVRQAQEVSGVSRVHAIVGDFHLGPAPKEYRPYYHSFVEESAITNDDYHKGRIANRRLHPETLMMGYGYAPGLSEGSLKPPIFLTSTFVFENAQQGKDFFDLTSGRRQLRPGEKAGLVYSRFDNPNLEILEDRLAIWDQAEQSAVFASGMAAISTTLFTFLRPGDTVLHSRPLYGGVAAEPPAHTKNDVSPDRSTFRTVLRDTFRSRAISRIDLPLTKCSRLIRPIVSTISISHRPPLTEAGSPAGRDSGGQSWTPIPRLRGSKLHAETQCSVTNQSFSR